MSTTFHTLCENFQGNLCKYSRKPNGIQNVDETGLFAQIFAIGICDACKVNMTAANDPDWFIHVRTI